MIVDKQAPFATSLARERIEKTELYMKKEGIIRQIRGVLPKQMKGFMSNEDMIRLNKIKCKYFLDNNKAERHIQNIRDRRAGVKPTGLPITNLLRNDEGGIYYLENHLVPMSSTLIDDSIETIE